MADQPIPLPPRPRAQKPCPVCGAAVVAAFRPFCSHRCAQRDLHRWLAGAYRVESDEAPDEKQDPAPRPER